MTAPYAPYLHEILIDSATLQARIRELGEQISADYADKKNLLTLWGQDFPSVQYQFLIFRKFVVNVKKYR